MHLVFAAVRFFPYWALPTILILFELGIFFRRKWRPAQFYCWGISGMFILATILWFIFRGDIHSDQWVRTLLPTSAIYHHP